MINSILLFTVENILFIIYEQRCWPALSISLFTQLPYSQRQNQNNLPTPIRLLRSYNWEWMLKWMTYISLILILRNWDTFRALNSTYKSVLSLIIKRLYEGHILALDQEKDLCIMKFELICGMRRVCASDNISISLTARVVKLI